ncbi:hypothetical protein FRC10_003082 [Ceratobasidium sp. 414]|nr:hypothetical protein FRC10_003082 [Ceratobasidium sp. 414]
MEVEVVGDSDEDVFAGIHHRRSARLFRSSSPASSPQKFTRSGDDMETWHGVGTVKTSSGHMFDEKTSESSRNSTPSSQTLREKSQMPRLPPLALSRRRAAGDLPTPASQTERVEQLKNDAEVARKVSGKRSVAVLEAYKLPGANYYLFLEREKIANLRNQCDHEETLPCVYSRRKLPQR